MGKEYVQRTLSEIPQGVIKNTIPAKPAGGIEPAINTIKAKSKAESSQIPTGGGGAIVFPPPEVKRPEDNNNPRIKEAMNTLLKMFDEDNLEKVARAVFKGNDIPSDKWSFLNRTLMYLNNTEDARGFRQWQQEGRYVQKGSKAFYILAPTLKKVTEEKTLESGETEKQEKQILTGFKAVPVFRFEDTEGESIIKGENKINIPCEFNSITKELGLKIDAVRFSGKSYGSYNSITKAIQLATPDIVVFLHELSHAVDDKLNGLKPGQHNDQEVTAEFSAAVIGHLMGYKVPLGNIKEYIEHYNFKELVGSLSRIERVVNYVIERTKTQSREAGYETPVSCMRGWNGQGSIKPDTYSHI